MSTGRSAIAHMRHNWRFAVNKLFTARVFALPRVKSHGTVLYYHNTCSATQKTALKSIARVRHLTLYRLELLEVFRRPPRQLGVGRNYVKKSSRPSSSILRLPGHQRFKPLPAYKKSREARCANRMHHPPAPFTLISVDLPLMLVLSWTLDDG